MEFIIGKDKFPLIKFEDNNYAHIFPITKYQFERYIWETEPDINYDEMLNTNPRISPHEVNKKNMKHLFITHISFRDAIAYCAWAGGRLPTISEKTAICEALKKISKNQLVEFCNKNDVDKRLLSLVSNEIKNLNVCSELFIELPMSFDGNYGDIKVGKLFEETMCLITGTKEDKLSHKGNFGFRIVIEEE